MASTAMNATSPRFEVHEHGSRDFSVHDNVSQLDYDFRFTRKAAQEAADRRNATTAKPSCVCGDPTTVGTVHRTDGPCYVDEEAHA